MPKRSRNDPRGNKRSTQRPGPRPGGKTNPGKKGPGKSEGKPGFTRKSSGDAVQQRAGGPARSTRPRKSATGRPAGEEGRTTRYTTPAKKFARPKSARNFSPPHRRHLKETEAKDEKIRLNKYIANSGISSRREADELIRMGLISVNGKIMSELGYKVSPGDVIKYEDKVLRAEPPVYILLNKPKGFITTTDDPQDRKTVMHIIGPSVKQRIYPVGRLDRNTTGLLLLTNDGDLADRLMHPSFNVKKVYKIELDKPLTGNDFQKIRDGVKLEEGRATIDDLAIVSEDGRTIGIELHIGWNRVVRRIFESLGYEVLKLDRTVYAGLDKKDLGRGQWRFLTKQEIIRLKHFK